MPNHIHNRLTIAGAPMIVSAFVEAAHAVPPRPGLSSHAKIAEWEREDREKTPPKPVALSFHAIVPLPEAYTSRPYDPYGYNAEHQMWGVKWGAYQIEPVVRSEDGTRATYAFQTAWGPPETWVEKASRSWPSLTFLVSYGGEGPARGRFAYQGGRVLTEQHDPYRKEDYPQLADDADESAEEAYHDAYQAAERLYVSTHDTWAAAFFGGAL